MNWQGGMRSKGVGDHCVFRMCLLQLALWPRLGVLLEKNGAEFHKEREGRVEANWYNSYLGGHQSCLPELCGRTKGGAMEEVRLENIGRGIRSSSPLSHDLDDG
jgi:hypothetical protein